MSFWQKLRCPPNYFYFYFVAYGQHRGDGIVCAIEKLSQKRMWVYKIGGSISCDVSGLLSVAWRRF